MRYSILFTVLELASGIWAQNTTEKFCGYTAVNGLTSQRNNQKCGPLLDDAFIPYNAYFMGTITLALTGNADRCKQQLYPMENYTVGIGGMKVTGNSSFSRSSYDTNPFYFWFKYQENKNISAGFLSSTDYFVTESQWWTLQSAKRGDGFDISGNYTGKLAPYSNVYNNPADGCWKVNIYNHIVSPDLTSSTKNWWTISGRLTPTMVNITIQQTIQGPNDNRQATFDFVGTPFAGKPGKGALLVTSESTPTTDLALKGVATTGNANGTTSSGSSSTNNTGSSTKKSDGIILGPSHFQGFAICASILVLLASAFAL
ncbi:hypothetical protein BGZ60DRAFT_47662 [Tricladium varicosporioides]|nr:hypothetical protein BGZ60DRAFT_47662 [Hymenoscyphus varicosporioides]